MLNSFRCKELFVWGFFNLHRPFLAGPLPHLHYISSAGQLCLLLASPPLSSSPCLLEGHTCETNLHKNSRLQPAATTTSVSVHPSAKHASKNANI